MSFPAVADDFAGLTGYLGIQKADVMGYSLGGIVALRTAIQHPELVNRLLIESSTFRRDGWYPEIVAAMSSMSASTAEEMKQIPLHKDYVSLPVPRMRQLPK